MHFRTLSWMLVFALLVGGALRAQVPAAATPAATAGGPTKPGLVLVARVNGTVTLTEGNQVTKPQLKQDDQIPQKAKVITQKGASIVLVFSNGASVQLAEDSELVLEEFLQDPFANTIKVAELEEEPTQSKTTISLNRGELVGSVKKLKKELSFTVNTPVGAAGIRGTTFRIVFRPGANGQAFFNLTTSTGVVAFTPKSGDGATTQTAPTVTATGTTNAVAVPQGQEIVFNVTVTTDPTSGSMTVVAQPVIPPTATAAQVANMQAATAVAVEIGVAVQNAVFVPPPAPAPTNSTGAPTTPTGTGDGSTPGSGTTTGSTTGSTTSGTTGSTTGTTGGSTTGTTGSTTGTTGGTSTPSSNSTPTTTTLTTPNATTTITVTPQPAQPPRITTNPN